MTMTRQGFSRKLFIEGLRKVAFDALNPKSLVYPQIYDIQTSDHEKEYDRTVAGLGMLDRKEEGEPLNYDEFVDGYESVYTHSTFAKGIRITEEMMEDMKYGLMNKRAAALGNAARYRMEYDHASLFNNANNTNIFTGGDGLALLSASHPLAGANGATYSNLSTADLTLGALETALTNFRRMVNDRNLLVEIKPKYLLIPPDLEFDAYEILKSSGKPYTADNEGNALQGRLTPIVWDFLTDTDCWFILSDKTYGAPVSFKRVGLQIKPDGDFDTGDIKIKARTRYSFGFSDWRWAYGSLGAG